MSYAQLSHAGNMADPDFARFQQNSERWVSDISVGTLFFTLELNKLDDANIRVKLDPWRLQRLALDRVGAPLSGRTSSPTSRAAAARKYVVGRAARQRMFDETVAEMRFRGGWRQPHQQQALNLLTDRDAAKRKSAAAASPKGFKAEQRLFALVTKPWPGQGDRGQVAHPPPVSSRNLANQVEDQVVEAWSMR